MRTAFSTLVVLALAVKLSAQDISASTLPKTNSLSLKIGTAAADKYYDQEMIVTGRVAQITVRATVTFLNIDKAFPDSPFTVVIVHGHSQFSGDANVLKGKSIEIRGKIKNYHDKPEIELNTTDQLTVFDSKGTTITPSILQSTNAPFAPQPTNAPPSASTNFPEIM